MTEPAHNAPQTVDDGLVNLTCADLSRGHMNPCTCQRPQDSNDDMLADEPRARAPQDERLTFVQFWAEAIALRERAGQGDLQAMQRLAAHKDPVWHSAFRDACIDVLGEDPDDWA